MGAFLKKLGASFTRDPPPRVATQQGTPPSTQQRVAPMLRWSGESRNEVGGQRRQVAHPTSPATSYSPVHPRTPHNPQRHEGEGRGFVLRSPKDGLSAGTWRRKVVMCPRRGNDPASGHPRAHQPPLGRGTSPPAWDGRLDAPGQRRRHLPSSAWTRRREVNRASPGAPLAQPTKGKGREGVW